VSLITSVTTKPNKTYETPIGCFKYYHLRLERYRIGITYRQMGHYHSVYIATPEKALADLVGTRKDLADPQVLRVHLVENLRIEEEDLRRLQVGHLYDIDEAYRTPTSRALVKVIGFCMA
jgi:hypothetical protein